MATGLSPKENYLRVVSFDDPEYVPDGDSLPVTNVGFYGVNPEDNRPPGAVAWTDFWGVGHEKEIEGVMPFPAHHPLLDMDNWESYRWPDPRDPERLGPTRLRVPEVDRSKRLLGVSHRSTLYERAWKLVGMENLLMLMGSEPEKADWVFENIIQFQIGIARQYLDEFNPDIAYLGDDLGSQEGLMFSPSLYRRFLKPRYARLIALYKERGKLVHFHSCGNVLGLVDDFMDLGIDILNPIQYRAIRNLPLLREKTAGRMALFGGIDTQYTLTLGSPEEVREMVRECIRILAPGGGYICSPDQSHPMPDANRQALHQAIDDFGRYPINC